MAVLKGNSVQLRDLQLIKINFSFIKKFLDIGYKENVKDYGKTTGKTCLKKGTHLVSYILKGNFQNRRQRDI